MSNYQSEELEKFSRLAHHWWDPSSACKPLHEINPLRLDFIKANTSLKDKYVLDVGCGGGILSEALAREGSQTSGIDLSAELITVAQNHALASQLTIDYQAISIEEFTRQNKNRFDVITCMELLEHTENPAGIIQSLVALLKPTGKLFLSTLNRNFKAYIQAILIAEYLLKLLPAGTHDYGHFIKPSELDREARKHQLVLKAVAGLSYNIVQQKYYLTDNVDVNYMVSYERISAQ